MDGMAPSHNKHGIRSRKRSKHVCGDAQSRVAWSFIGHHRTSRRPFRLCFQSAGMFLREQGEAMQSTLTTIQPEYKDKDYNMVLQHYAYRSDQRKSPTKVQIKKIEDV